MSRAGRQGGHKTDRTGRSKGQDSHVRLHRWLLRSPAWQHLSLPGRALLIELYSRHYGTNNGEIVLSVREAAALLNVCNDTVLKAFRELEAKGFIRPNMKGAFSLKVRHATTWILTEFPFANQLSTKDFMSWQPDGEIRKPVRRDRTDSSTRSNRDAATVLSGRTDSSTRSNRQPVFDPPHGSTRSNTVCLPGTGERPDRDPDPDLGRAALAEPDETPVDDVVEERDLVQDSGDPNDPDSYAYIPPWLDRRPTTKRTGTDG